MSKRSHQKRKHSLDNLRHFQLFELFAEVREINDLDSSEHSLDNMCHSHLFQLFTEVREINDLDS